MAARNPRVYLDVAIGTKAGGRVIFELFADVTPRTAENFRGLCTGEYGLGRTTKKPLCYEGCTFFRSMPGTVVQSGDFQFNNGDGGESIYGGHFNDEDFVRRHTQAGILSMANRGRNTNGSQFFVTLKRYPRFDGRHIAFGQVISGMDVIRAIGQVPVDADDRPRVPVTIVGSGEVGRANKSPADLTVQVGKQIVDMNEDIAPSGVRVTEASKGRALLAGKRGGAPEKESELTGSSHQSKLASASADAEDGEGGAAAVPARNERERRLFELRLRMNQGRTKNNKEVVDEQKRAADPDYGKKKAYESQKKEEKLEADEGDLDEKLLPGNLPKRKAYLLDSAETVEKKNARRKKGNPEAFGWDVFNAESLLRGHEKRLKHIGFDEAGYKEQKEKLKDDPSIFAGFGHKPTEAAKDRLQNAMEQMIEKRGQFSRRRDFIEDEDVTYINERNSIFNKKLQRYFGAYTEEMRQNLERGTAL